MTSRFPNHIEENARFVIEAYSRLGLKLATAESCTGGLIAGCLTEIPGSSVVFERGFVTYSNAAKIETIGVDPDLIDHYGAVSQQVAHAMALGVLQHSQADIALSVTGIAGPGGGSPEKPVGLVYLAIAKKNGLSQTSRYQFDNQERDAVRLNAVHSALKLLQDAISDFGQNAEQ